MELRLEVAGAPRPVVLVSCPESHSAAGVGRCVDLVLGLGHTTVVVDLGGRADADAELLGTLRRCAGRARDAGGRLAVVCSDSRLRRLFDVTLLSQCFAVHATREEALAG